MTTTKLCPFNSMISPGFWQKFSNLVLDQKTTELDRVPIWGYYGPSNVQFSILSVDHTSFDEIPGTYYNQIPVKGEIIVTKTLKEFKEIDKNQLIAQQIQNKLSVEQIEQNPTVLTSFFILAYADLKSYVFTYWFGFPARSSLRLTYDSPTPYEITDEAYKNLCSSSEVWKQGYFLYDPSNNKVSMLGSNQSDDDLIYGYVEPSGIENVPGWVVRNYAAYIVNKRNLKNGDKFKVLSLKSSKDDNSRCCIYNFTLEFPEAWEAIPKILGWERNGDKLTPKVVDLKSNLDPVTLSESFVDFNLKLMKWRLFPEFDLELMHTIKVCIIGAGTLGCNVARALMGWGVRHIDLVDSAKVSYSNPVRQNLYTYKDSGKPKAETAAENLKNIFPGVVCRGYNIHIPMPGHPSSPSTVDKIKDDFKTLEELVQKNDVLFLLTDTRESRWAPTLLGATWDKLTINAALGFDSYVVIRHGRKHENLGCYFCTDVVPPGDVRSTQDRTLDQQCTVTRPGVSMIAGALAVELMTSTIHFDKDSQNPTLGIPAHSLRGWLSSGQNISPTFQKFDKCSACSEKVLEQYKQDGIEFILRVLESPRYLESISGLDTLKEGLEGIIELDDDDFSE